jgi:hypothetical protein
MRLLQPLSDVYFGSLHIHLTVLQAGSTTKYLAPLIDTRKIGRQPVIISRELVLFLSNRQIQEFLVNNTTKNLHCINKMDRYVDMQQLDSFKKY